MIHIHHCNARKPACTCLAFNGQRFDRVSASRPLQHLLAASRSGSNRSMFSLARVCRVCRVRPRIGRKSATSCRSVGDQAAPVNKQPIGLDPRLYSYLLAHTREVQACAHNL